MTVWARVMSLHFFAPFQMIKLRHVDAFREEQGAFPLSLAGSFCKLHRHTSVKLCPQPWFSETVTDVAVDG